MSLPIVFAKYTACECTYLPTYSLDNNVLKQYDNANNGNNAFGSIPCCPFANFLKKLNLSLCVSFEYIHNCLKYI